MNRYRIASNRVVGGNYKFGRYFVTICTRDKTHYFGQIVDGMMVLNDMGNVVNQYRSDIPKHFSNIQIDEFVVMPNHVHGILVLNIRRDVALQRLYDNEKIKPKSTSEYFSQISPKIGTLGTIIRSFKSACTYQIHKLGYKFHRQSNYHEHTIRNDIGLQSIRQYIQNNPQMRYRDRNNV